MKPEPALLIDTEAVKAAIRNVLTREGFPLPDQVVGTLARAVVDAVYKNSELVDDEE